MTCEPFCDSCGGNLGHPANGDWTCAKCKAERICRSQPGYGTHRYRGDPYEAVALQQKTQIDALRKGRKERIRKDEFEPGNPVHFRLQTRGGAWRYYRKVA